jgi:hypothetical protein
VRSNGDLHRFGIELSEPGLRNSQFWWGATPEQVRRRSWDNEEIRVEFVESLFHLLDGELIGLGIDEQRFVPGGGDLVVSEQ